MIISSADNPLLPEGSGFTIHLGYAASGASDIRVAHQMGHSRIETTKNIYGHLFAQDRTSSLDAMNQAVSRLYAYEDQAPEAHTAA
jgi:hypothetical protein